MLIRLETVSIYVNYLNNMDLITNISKTVILFYIFSHWIIISIINLKIVKNIASNFNLVGNVLT